MIEEGNKEKQRGKERGDAKPHGESHSKPLHDNDSHSEMKGISMAEKIMAKLVTSNV